MPKKEPSPFAVIKKAIGQGSDVLEIYKTLPAPHQDKVLTMVASHLGNKDDWSSVQDLLNVKSINLETIDDLETGIVLINCLLSQDEPDPDMAVAVLEKLHGIGKIRKKHVTLVSNYYKEKRDWLKTHMLFQKYHVLYTLDTADLDWIFDEHVPAEIRSVVLEHFCKEQSPVQTQLELELESLVEADELNLNKIPFTESECKTILGKLPIPKGQLKIETQPDDKLIVVDAANVMFYNYHKGIQPQSYYQLNNIVKCLQETYPGYHIILVMHQRHFKLGKYEKGPQSWSSRDLDKVERIIDEWYCNTHVGVYKTPYGQNDDHYSIYIAIQHNCPLVTNDKFMDHINKIGLLKVWRSEMIVGYDIAKGSVKPQLVLPLNFSCRHQSDATNYYIPTNDPQLWKVVKR